MTETHACGCSEEYGPCDDHSEVMAQREGSSMRTADDLSHVFCLDAIALGVAPSPYGSAVLERVRTRLESQRRNGVAWLNDSALQDELSSVVNALETDLETLDMSVYWDDGYRIVKMKDGCPLKD